VSKIEVEVRTWRELLAQGRLSEALEAQLRTDPDAQTTKVLERLGDMRAHLRAKRWGRSQGVIEALEARPGFLDWTRLLEELSTLGASGKLLERGEAEAALERLRTVTLPLLEAEAETQRGTAYVFLDRGEEAERAFSRALELDPGHYRALTNRGNLALEEGRVDEAIQAYEAALHINEDFPNAHHNLGVAYRRKGQVSRSVRAIRRAQRTARRQEQEAAQGQLKEMGKGNAGRLFKYVLYALGAVGLFLLLRAQGVI